MLKYESTRIARNGTGLIAQIKDLECLPLPEPGTKIKIDNAFCIADSVDGDTIKFRVFHFMPSCVGEHERPVRPPRVPVNPKRKSKSTRRRMTSRLL